MKPFNRSYVCAAKLLSPVWWVLAKMRPNSKSWLEGPPKKILVFDFHLIGDIVLLIPLLESLRNGYPKSKITLVAGPWAADILRGNDAIDNLEFFLAPWVKPTSFIGNLLRCFELVRKLSVTQWDLGIEVRGDIRQILLMWMIGPRRRIGYNFTGGSYLLTDVIEDNGGLSHLADHNKRIAEHLAVWPSDKKYQPIIRLTHEERVFTEEFPSYIGFHFGASLPLRAFPEKEIKNLLMQFTESRLPLVVFIPPDDNGMVELAIKELPNFERISILSCDLRSLVLRLSRARHFFCMDSGPAHIAAALNIPSTIFFGPAEFNYVHPIGTNTQIISKQNVSCRPCDQVTCKNAAYQFCMIGLAEIFESEGHDPRRKIDFMIN